MENNSLIGMVNADYTIIKQGSKAVLGESVSPYGKLYVAWNYKFENAKPVFYGEDTAAEIIAEKCFEMKERGEYPDIN